MADLIRIYLDLCGRDDFIGGALTVLTGSIDICLSSGASAPRETSPFARGRTGAEGASSAALLSCSPQPLKHIAATQLINTGRIGRRIAYRPRSTAEIVHPRTFRIHPELPATAP